MSVPALVPSAAVIVLLAALTADLLACSRGRAPTRADPLVAGAALLAAPLLAGVLALDSPARAGEFLAAWGAALAMTVVLVVLLVVLTHRLPGSHRLVPAAVGASALTRIALAGTGLPGLPLLSAVSGAAVLLGAWWLFRRDDSGLPEPGAARFAAIPAAVVLGAFAATATGGDAAPVLCANLLPLLGAARVVRTASPRCRRAPGAAVGGAAVLVFFGVEALLAGLAGRGPGQDASVTGLSLAMTLLVVVLGAITAVRSGR
ncbi:hypothetical protein [Saccharopolyspora flava]|uniref:Uncharacterized protein n=1 Tax=Saccharopolyspora flava TaxID=95161 RepID=A0A1I6SN51_9PSEU|nr:hypothetical protein [Saccharopolyspora flava]SFS78383.1 hypothetical protein SAMN05660874_03252 [Saccharopolyspora flava]